jgi:hypothetical protein
LRRPRCAQRGGSHDRRRKRPSVVGHHSFPP